MKPSRMVALIAVVVVVALVALYAIAAITQSKPPASVWVPGAGYPVQLGGTYAIAGQQCFDSGSYVTCVGGQDYNAGPRTEVYSSSPVSSTSANITRWTAEAQYPQDINGQSCVVDAGFVYCVGGTDDPNGDDTNSSYYAPLTGGDGGIGAWNSTTAFPVPIDSQSCVGSSGYVYCVGGNNETDGIDADSVATNSVWFAPLSSAGIGRWSHTTAYPEGVLFPSCFAAGGYVYCVGGADSNDNPVSTDYFAPLSSSGVGAWTQTTAYKLSASGQACAVSSGLAYCVGGEEADGTYTAAAYYASLSSGGIGAWSQMPAYPLSSQTTCTILSGEMYCVGGFDATQTGETAAVYHAPLTSLSG